ncbi:MAG TPA: hypothetical protein VIK62_04130 [Verrucomicrobiae bacterium]
MGGQVYGKINNYFSARYFFHRALMALRAISFLRFAESFLARALPPFEAPSLPSATAAGFFFFDVGGMDGKYNVSHQ